MKQWIAIALLSVSIAGCKQGLGERCESNEDCAEGTCTVRSGNVSFCVTAGGSNAEGMIDAEPPPDAAIDAAVP